jgi:hypothetical protein
MRLVRKGKAITPDREIIPWLYVQNVARKNSMGLDEVVYGMTAAPFKFARFAHAACYFLDDDRHHGNFMLCTDGVTKSVSDLGSVYEMNSLESHRVDDILRIIINHTTFLSKLPAQFQRLERSPYLEYPDDEVLEKSIGVALKVLGPR